MPPNPRKDSTSALVNSNTRNRPLSWVGGRSSYSAFKKITEEQPTGQLDTLIVREAAGSIYKVET